MGLRQVHRIKVAGRFFLAGTCDRRGGRHDLRPGAAATVAPGYGPGTA